MWENCNGPNPAWYLDKIIMHGGYFFLLLFAEMEFRPKKKLAETSLLWGIMGENGVFEASLSAGIGAEFLWF